MTDWQEPIRIYNVHEVSSAMGFRQDSPEVYVEVRSERDAWMLSEGHACMNCYATFPARPSALTVKEFEPFGMWGDNPKRARERVMLGACPVCACEITPENYEKQLVQPE